MPRFYKEQNKNTMFDIFDKETGDCLVMDIEHEEDATQCASELNAAVLFREDAFEKIMVIVNEYQN